MCYSEGVNGWVTGSAAFCALLVPACSGSSDAPLVEYPPLADPSAASDPATDPSHDGGAPSAADATAPAPVAGKKIASGSIFIASATTDGALVFEQDADLMVWPDGAPAPLMLVQDYTTETDSFSVRGRFVAAWLGDDLGATMPKLWSKTAGITTFPAKIHREAIYPKAGSDDFAYYAPSSGILNREVWATKAGAGAGTKIVAGLDVGLTQKQCRPTVTYAVTDLVVAGCPDFTTTASVTAYALDGSNTKKTILAGSAPGVFVNRARTHAVVQTSTASSIRALSGAGAPVPLDGPILQATFSADGSKVLYLTAAGKLKRAATTAPSAPTELATAFTAFGFSPDGRFVVFATKGNTNQNRYDILTLDASTPATPARTLVPQEGTYVGMSKSGTQIVYLGEDAGAAFGRPLSVVTLPAGAPQILAPEAERVTFADDVVYWQEWVPAKKWNVLKAARLSAPSQVVTIDDGLDPLTSHALVVGKKLFVGSKLGLWEYPAL